MGLFSKLRRNRDDDPLRVGGQINVTTHVVGDDDGRSDDHGHSDASDPLHVFADMMRSGGAFSGGSVQLTGDLSHISDRQREQLRAFGIDLDALASASAAAQAAAPAAFTIPASGAGGAPGGDDETLSRLERLAKLREQGVLTDEEFATQKRRILGEAD
ncbi:SHOCT domain-containing protein [Conexibacter sp. CPCC 206217]|uniref:SHOCT domain-containing protein n=1 Tax=Conexibacter sp. CPCC 206217 TaxID=3064574 RepID=UPI00271FE5AF|nr:SHOCT domain-containing protein [Conexibacter sp. CPCC 206217]MDO8209010.1 SHOCT domain-containing protein [Conexibacter sp. CPCC 206217]